MADPIEMDGLRDAVAPVYWPFMFDRNRYATLYGGAGSGKSHAACQKMLTRILAGYETEIKHKFLVLRKTQPAVRKSTFALAKNYRREWGLQSISKVKKQELLIDFDNGSQIMFSGLDDPEKIKSIEGVTGIWLEEATEFTFEDYLQCDMRLRGPFDSYYQIMMTFNPSEDFWAKDEFIKKVNPDASVLKTTYEDNPFLDEKYKEVLENLRYKDEMTWKIYAKGEWGELKHKIYDKWVIKEVSRDPEDYKKIFYGLDFGFVEPAAWIKMGWKDGELYILDEIYTERKTNDQLSKMAYEGGFMEPNGLTIADSAEPKSIEEIKDQRFNIRGAIKGADSVNYGNNWLRGIKWYIHPECVNVIKEIKKYRNKTDRAGNVLEEPIDYDDHSMAAIRYGTEIFRPAKKPGQKRVRAW